MESSKIRCGRRRRKRKHRPNWPVLCCHDQKLIRLRKWMKKEAGFDISLFPAVFSDTGRGLLTKKSILPGETIVSLPQCLMITTATVLNSEIGPVIKRWEPSLSPQHCLTIFLVWEKHKQCKSNWYPYIDSLPATFTTPAYFSKTELSFLPPSVRLNAFLEAEKVTDLYAITQTWAAENWKSFADIFTYKDFRWAWYVVNTRSVYFDAGKSEYLCAEEPDNMALAPFLDLLNHSPEVTIDPFFNKVTNCYEIVTYTAYRPYQQVFISYGCLGNQKLFIEYGFCVPNNPHDAIEILFDRLLTTCTKHKVSHLEKKLSLLRENDLLSDLTCSVDEMSWKFRAVLKTMGMDWQQLQNWSKIFTEDGCKNELSPEVQLLAMDILKEYMTEIKATEAQFIKGREQIDNPAHLRIIEALLKLETDIISSAYPT